MTGAEGARLGLEQVFSDMHQFYILVNSCTPLGLFRRKSSWNPLNSMGI